MSKSVNGYTKCLTHADLEGKTIKTVFTSPGDDEIFMLTTDGELVFIGAEGYDEDDPAPCFNHLVENAKLDGYYRSYQKYRNSDTDVWSRLLDEGVVSAEAVAALDAEEERDRVRREAERRAHYELLKKEFEPCPST